MVFWNYYAKTHAPWMYTVHTGRVDEAVVNKQKSTEWNWTVRVYGYRLLDIFISQNIYKAKADNIFAVKIVCDYWNWIDTTSFVVDLHLTWITRRTKRMAIDEMPKTEIV